MDDAIVDMQQTVDPKKTVTGDGEAFALEKVRRKDDVGVAGLVFEGEEDKAFGYAGRWR